ncbi:MAG: cell division protein FtsA [Francisellaceae bacterium]|jgi:cell division protein FtsA|nr:cell division protein FtsA [Francisellaceae bacterium]MBT6206604.1 cell division protein FtsA [Francisellaceae bacterium]MBT6539247.1 cell division protein FtsA [Francisellaceae bacterium]
MPKKQESNLIVALDIGTSKVLAVVAEVLPDGIVEVIGIGKHNSTGLRKGVVVNIEATVKAVQKAVDEAELMAGCHIHSVYTGISGAHIRSFNSHGIVAIKDRQVEKADVERSVEAAKAVSIPADQKIIHIIPRNYVIDGQSGIKDPIGMSGIRLETDIHVITGSVSVAQNIINCIRRCDLEVDDIILQQLASSAAVLTEDEKHLGVCMIDIGGGTTDVAVYFDNALQHTAVLPIGGNQVTHDLAVALRTSTEHAESIKIKHAYAMADMGLEEMVDIPNMGENRLQSISSNEIAKVVEPRIEELFILVRDELRKIGLEGSFGTGVALVGGTAKMKGIVELAESIFQTPVRVALPMGVVGLTDVIEDPRFATGVGLLKYCVANKRGSQRNTSFSERANVQSVWHKIKCWLQGNM